MITRFGSGGKHTRLEATARSANRLNMLLEVTSLARYALSSWRPPTIIMYACVQIYQPLSAGDQGAAKAGTRQESGLGQPWPSHIVTKTRSQREHSRDRMAFSDAYHAQRTHTPTNTDHSRCSHAGHRRGLFMQHRIHPTSQFSQ